MNLRKESIVTKRVAFGEPSKKSRASATHELTETAGNESSRLLSYNRMAERDLRRTGEGRRGLGLNGESA
jgi:hypothetical protein